MLFYYVLYVEILHIVIPRIKYITDLAYLAKTNPILALTFTITMFSMAGIPPLAGFYSKAYLFFATMSSGLYLLALIGVLTSVLSCFYYIRLVKIMYFEVPKTWCSYTQVPYENALTLGLSLFFYSNVNGISFTITFNNS